MTRDSESTTIASTKTTASAIGIVSTSAPVPAIARMRIASSVAYAEEEMLSEARIGRPVSTPMRSSASASECRRLPIRNALSPCHARPTVPVAAMVCSVAT